LKRLSKKGGTIDRDSPPNTPRNNFQKLIFIGSTNKLMIYAIFFKESLALRSQRIGKIDLVPQTLPHTEESETHSSSKRPSST